MRVRSPRNQYEVIAQTVCHLGSWLDRNSRFALMLILLLALVPGVVTLWRLEPGMWKTNVLWSQIALNVANGQGYVSCDQDYFPFCGPTNQVTAAREPLPVLLFAALARVTGSLQPVGNVVELILNLAILIGVFSITHELGGTRPALLAGLIWALYLPATHIFYPAIAGDALATLGVTWALFFFLRAASTNRSLDWLMSGTCLGIGALSRSSVVILVPVLAIFALIRPRIAVDLSPFSIKTKLWPSALFLCAFVMLLVPWMARNYLAFDRVVIGTTLSGYNLYRHNAMLLTDDYLKYVGPEEGRSAVQALLAGRPDLHGTENEAQMDAVYRHEALRIISAAPARYVYLSAYRFFLLWFNWGVNAKYDKNNTVLDAAMMVQQGALLLLGMVGSLSSSRRVWPLSLSVGTFLLVHMAVMGRLYLLMPVMPLAVVLSALGAIWIVAIRVRGR
jgi:dolichyl-phosphate-mannose-protein mannosyltransferase